MGDVAVVLLVVLSEICFLAAGFCFGVAYSIRTQRARDRG